MAVIQMHHSSKALKKQTSTWFILPDELPEGPLPVVYLLHGLSDEASTWFRRTAIERHAQAHRMLIVCPDGGRGWYSNAHSGYGLYEDHILEIVEMTDRTFQTNAQRRARGIGGLSMGGYGAMKLGLKYPQLFASVVSHSGALDVVSRTVSELGPEFAMIFGDQVPASDNCFKLAEQPGTKPRIRFDCGTEDFLLQHNRDFQSHLTELGVAHEYEEFPGGHSWDYWDQHVVTALAFHADTFASDPGTDSAMPAI